MEWLFAGNNNISGLAKPTDVQFGQGHLITSLIVPADFLSRRLKHYENKKINLILRYFCHLAGINFFLNNIVLIFYSYDTKMS